MPRRRRPLRPGRGLQPWAGRVRQSLDSSLSPARPAIGDVRPGYRPWDRARRRIRGHDLRWRRGCGPRCRADGAGVPPRSCRAGFESWPRTSECQFPGKVPGSPDTCSFPRRPSGGWMWAASPAMKTRPPRYRAAKHILIRKSRQRMSERRGPSGRRSSAMASRSARMERGLPTGCHGPCLRRHAGDGRGWRRGSVRAQKGNGDEHVGRTALDQAQCPERDAARQVPGRVSPSPSMKVIEKASPSKAMPRARRTALWAPSQPAI